MQVFNINQRTPEWHQFRKEGIGSSDIADILGNGKFTWKQLYDQKIGMGEPVFQTDAMRNGIEQEEFALECLRQKEDPNAKPVCGVHDMHSFVRASFDAYSPEAIYEIKTPYSDKTFESYLDGNLPEKWLDQVRWQMLVSDVKVGYIVLWTGKDYVLKRIKWDFDWESHALNQAQAFWSHVESLDAPDLTEKDYLSLSPNDQERLALMELESLESALKKVKDELKPLELRRKEIINQLVSQKDQNFFMGQYRFTKVDGIHKVDYKRALKEHEIEIDLSEYTSRSASYWRVS